MEKENIIEILEEFLDFLKEKEDSSKKEDSSDTEVEFIIEPDDTENDDFDKVINKISNGE